MPPLAGGLFRASGLPVIARPVLAALRGWCCPDDHNRVDTFLDVEKLVAVDQNL
jgi:hypothetical protein